MKKAKIGELRNGLSRYLAHVRAGGTVIVYERDTPIAEITPIAHAGNRKVSDKERLVLLEKKGVIRRGAGDRRWYEKHKPIKVPGGSGVLDAVLEERKSGW